ncbi:Ribulose-phosphate 3-epimerase [Klebsiella pneumoniae]|nr:Ribulose-phosphate 3-epimerase [Klebsiella pneumoniae]
MKVFDCPSILSADFARLGEDTAKALAVRMSCTSTLWTTTTCQT